MSDDKDRLDFLGRGFDRGEFTEDERAAMRERNHHYDRNFLSPEKLIEATGLGWLVNISKGLPAFIKMLAAIGTLGGAIAAAQALGWL